MSENKIFIKRIVIVFASKFITSLRGLILLPLLTKFMGPSNYGIWSQILVTIGIFSPVIMLNLTGSTVRFLSAEKDNKKISQGLFTVFFTTFFVGIFFALALFLFSDSFANILLKEPSASFFIKLTSVLLILEALNQTALESFRVIGQIKKYSKLTIFQNIFEVGLIAIFIFSGFGLFGAIIALLIGRILIILISLYSIISSVGFNAPNFSVLKTYLIFGLPFLPMGIFEMLINLSDRYIIGFFKGAQAVGIYSATHSIGLLAGVFVFPIAYILSPTVFKFFDENKIDKVKSYLSFALKYFLLFSIPSIFGLFILAKTMLRTLATPEFVLLNSMFIVLWVAMGSVFYGIQAIYSNIIMIEKKTKFFIFAFAIGFFVNIVLNIIFIPIFGIMAAAFNAAISHFIVAFLIYLKSIKYIKFNFDFLFFIKSIFASLIMSLSIYFINPIGITKTILVIVLGVIVYFIVLFLTKSFSKEEIKILISSVKKDNFSKKY